MERSKQRLSTRIKPWATALEHIPKRSCSEYLRGYADDHQVYSAGEKIEDVETILNDEGNRTSEWYQQNLLKCNQDKFQAMSLGPRHTKKEMNLNVKDINIKSSPGIDRLGVVIDD